MKTQLNYSLKSTFFVVVLITIVILGIVSSSSILKDEAIKNHLKIAELHSSTLSKQMTQTISSTELIINNIDASMRYENNLDNLFVSILNHNPHIRSVNIVEEGNIIYSSNKKNLKIRIDTSNYYPKPFFQSTILRIGKLQTGRDFDTLQSDKSSTFLPILKSININETPLDIIIALNNDYFINEYSNNLDTNLEFVDIFRLDGTLLFSSDKNIKSKVYGNHELFQESLEKSRAVDVITLNEKKYFLSFSVSNYYPLNIGIRLDYKKSMESWREKRELFLIVIIVLIVISSILILILILKHNKEKDRELKLQREQIANQKKFKLLFEQSVFLAATIKEDGRISDINMKALNMLGNDYDEVLDKNFWDLDCWTQKDKLYLKELIQNFNIKQTIHEEFEITNQSGQSIMLDFSLSSIQLEGKTEIVALSQDITKRKKEEKELRQAYIVFENTHDGILITDERANIINVNKSFINSTGYTLEDVLHKNPSLLQSGLHSKSFYSKMWEILKKENFWEGELFNKNKRGKIYSSRMSINAVYDEYGKLTNYIGVFWDTTKQKEQEDKLKKQEELLNQQSKMAAMGEMLENIAHQWRQPLSMISTTSTGLKLQKQMNTISEEEEFKHLDNINNYVQHLSSTIEYFRDFLKENKVVKELSLKECIAKTHNLISSKFKNREITIIQNIEEAKIRSIETELMQVFMNILNNAKDAFEKNKIKNRMVFIDTKIIDDTIEIKIKDNAGGVPPEILKKVFDPYFTTKHQSQGTGIGLYMSREIVVKKMKGTIVVQNSHYTYQNKEYKGALFIISLPLNG